MTAARGINNTTALLLRYLFQAIVFAIIGFFVANHSLLLQSNASTDVHGWAPSSKMEQNEAELSMGRPTKPNNLTQSLPQWLVEYAKWHDETRRANNWIKQPVLVVVAKDDLAEGLSDRLRSLPFLLWEAHQTKRLLLVQWLRPYPLEEFLLPPSGGIDWRVPPSLTLTDPSEDVLWHEYQNKFISISDSPYQRFRVVKTQPNRYTFMEGMDVVYMTMDPKIQDEQLSTIYKLLLTPSPPVQKLLDDTMQKLGLTSKTYIGVHLRARYPDYAVHFQFAPNHGWNESGNDNRTIFDRKNNKSIYLDPKGLAVDKRGIMETDQVVGQLKQLVARAIQCARTNIPGADPPTTMYFASDTNLAIKLAMNTSKHIVGSVTSKERLHMNVDNENKEYKPADFYPAVVDIWILSQAKCLAAGQGGYTLFAAVLGGVGNCTIFTVVQNFYLVRHLPHGYITIRNVTICKPQTEKMANYWRRFFFKKEQRLKQKPRRKDWRKHYAAQATWNIGN